MEKKGSLLSEQGLLVQLRAHTPLGAHQLWDKYAAALFMPSNSQFLNKMKQRRSYTNYLTGYGQKQIIMKNPVNVSLPG